MYKGIDTPAQKFLGFQEIFVSPHSNISFPFPMLLPDFCQHSCQGWQRDLAEKEGFCFPGWDLTAWGQKSPRAACVMSREQLAGKAD